MTNEEVLQSFCVHKINVSDTSEYIIIYYYKSPHDKYKSNIVRRPCVQMGSKATDLALWDECSVYYNWDKPCERHTYLNIAVSVYLMLRYIAHLFIMCVHCMFS